ncbi:hypothetical protein AYO40_03835 [Planctomycetaceae bacterium SCGC AG-212-D15]|nr:hypothetical protein AYO40_03835 [Planctomycetaceae bacterium SCGC AG-212-D15]
MLFDLQSRHRVLQQDIRRLEVAVKDAALVGVVHGAGQIFDQPGGVLSRLRCAGNPPGEAAAVDVLQREIGPVLLLAHFMDLDDVGMLQSGDGLGFRAKPNQFLARRVLRAENHFQRDHALQIEMKRLVDHAHAAAAQDAQDLIADDARQARCGGGLLLEGAGRWLGLDLLRTSLCRFKMGSIEGCLANGGRRSSITGQVCLRRRRKSLHLRKRDPLGRPFPQHHVGRLDKAIGSLPP